MNTPDIPLPIELAEAAAWRDRLPRLGARTARWAHPARLGRLAALAHLADPAAAALSRALGRPCRLEALRLAPGQAPVAGAVFPLALGPDLTPATLRLDPAACAALVSAVAGQDVPVPTTGPDRLTAALLAHALLTALEALGGAGLPPAALAAGAPGPTAVTLSGRLQVGARAGWLQLDLPEAAAERLLAALPPDAAPLPEALAACPVPVALCLGPVRLFARTVAGLEPGDALLPAPDLVSGTPWPQGPAFLRTGAGRVARGRLRDGRFHVEALGRPRPTTTEELPMHPDAEDDLQVDLHCVLATVPATLAEVAALQPGAVVPLPDPDPRVRLVLGERTVAVGELVDLEGRLAVRILSRR